MEKERKRTRKLTLMSLVAVSQLLFLFYRFIFTDNQIENVQLSDYPSTIYYRCPNEAFSISFQRMFFFKTPQRKQNRYFLLSYIINKTFTIDPHL